MMVEVYTLRLDPAVYKQAEKLEINKSNKNTFEAIAEEWFISRMRDKSESHKKRTRSNIGRFLIPASGKMPIKDITPPIVLSLLKKLRRKELLTLQKG